ncbi:MAG: hypothetical protein JWP06_1186 [Candidatus Saccharibacteria bacterium]|nr:hypothetical protein [Candidatus Saccharibacteria bacterium]
MAFLRFELRVIDHIARDFRSLFGDDAHYNCSDTTVRFRVSSGAKNMMRVIQTDRALRIEFCSELEARINKGRAGNQRLMVSDGSPLLRELSRRQIGSGVELIGVHPALEPRPGDGEAMRRYKSMHRIFRIDPAKGLVFIPFTV